MNHDQKYIDWQDRVIRYPRTKNQLRTFKHKKDITRKLNSSDITYDLGILKGDTPGNFEIFKNLVNDYFRPPDFRNRKIFDL